MFGLDEFGILVFATASKENFKIYDWKDQCKEYDFRKWDIKDNARAESEDPGLECWR